jgi:predicted enzyme related to lactoylglutathione lyase
MEPFEIPDVGRFAVMQDPQGAYFTVIRTYVVDPPPGH